MYKTTNPDNYVGVKDSTGLAAIFLVFHNSTLHLKTIYVNIISSQADIRWEKFLQFCICRRLSSLSATWSTLKVCGILASVADGLKNMRGRGWKKPNLTPSPTQLLRRCSVSYGRDPFNQNFRKFRSKTQWIGSVQPESFEKTSPLFEVGHFSRSDRLEFWLNGLRPIFPRIGSGC